MGHAIARKLVFENLHLVIERDQQAAAQVFRRNLFLHPVGASVEAAFPPAGQVQRRLAQRLGGNGAGVNGHAADALALFDHQHLLSELGSLDCGAAAGRTAADDEEIIVSHEETTESLCVAGVLRSRP